MCPRCGLEDLIGLAAGDLNRWRAARLRRHLRHCAACQAEWETVQQLWTQARALRSDAIPDGLANRILVQHPWPVSALEPNHSVRPGARRWQFLVSLAVLVIVIAGSPLFRAKAAPTSEALYKGWYAKMEAAHSVSGEVEVQEGDRKRIFTFQLLKPRYYRVASHEMALYGDGKTHWTYYPLRQQYLKLKQVGPGMAMLPVIGAPFLAGLPGFEAITDPVKAPSHFAPWQPATFQGIACRAIPLEFNNEAGVHYTLYLSKGSPLPLGWRRQHGVQSITGIYRNLKLNIPLQPAEFAWTPPQGITRLYIPAHPEETLLKPGDDAPRFSLPTADGASLRLKDVLAHHKVVLLHFWTYGYLGSVESVRDDFAKLARLNAEMSTNGGALVSINSGDAPETVRAFARQNGLTFPMLMDRSVFSHDAVSEQYGIRSLPTFYLLDAQGKILTAFDRFDEKALRAALQNAGISVTTL